jgi:sugar lactone lactonase YvrE
VPIDGAGLDRRGHLMYRAGEPARTWVLPAGATSPISFGTWDGSYSGGTLAPDGKSLLISTGARIMRITAAGGTPVAGLDPKAQVSGNASDLALFEPMTMTVASDGEVWLTDRRRRSLMRIDAADQVHEVTLADPAFKEGQSYTFNFPNMRPGPDGTVLMLARMKSGEGLYRIREDGSSSLVYKPPTGKTVGDFAPRGDDVLLLLTGREQPHQLVVLARDGTTRTVFESQIVWTEYPRPNAEPYRSAKPEPNLGACDLLPAPSGDVWIFGQERIARWSTAKGFEVVRKGVHLIRPEEQNEGYTRGAATLGPDGAVYFTPGDMGNGSWNEVRRWDPLTGIEEHIAGTRGTIFQGGGVDDSLNDPHSPAFSPAGDLYFIDAGSKQVRRIPKDRLTGNPLTRDSNPEE